MRWPSIVMLAKVVAKIATAHGGPLATNTGPVVGYILFYGWHLESVSEIEQSASSQKTVPKGEVV